MRGGINCYRALCIQALYSTGTTTHDAVHKNESKLIPQVRLFDRFIKNNSCVLWSCIAFKLIV